MNGENSDDERGAIEIRPSDIKVARPRSRRSFFSALGTGLGGSVGFLFPAIVEAQIRRQYQYHRSDQKISDSDYYQQADIKDAIANQARGGGYDSDRPVRPDTKYRGDRD